VQLTGVGERVVGEKGIGLEVKIVEELEGLAGGLFPANKPGCKKRT
jgi:hypothetical protein